MNRLISHWNLSNEEICWNTKSDLCISWFFIILVRLTAFCKLNKTILENYTSYTGPFHCKTILDFLKQYMNCRNDLITLLDFFKNLIEIKIFDIQLLPLVGDFTDRMLSEEDAEADEQVLKFYATLCAKRRPISSNEGLFLRTKTVDAYDLSWINAQEWSGIFIWWDWLLVALEM